MNTKALQKHYDKLTVEERVSAMIAALGRDDMEEYKTLGQAAPKGKAFQVRDAHGLLSAIEWLGMWHILNQLGCIATFNILLSHEGDMAVKDHYTQQGISMDEAMQLSFKRIIEGRTAWYAICDEYNLDPRDALQPYPYVEVIELEELMADAICIEMDIHPEPEQTIESYRLAMKTKRAEWE